MTDRTIFVAGATGDTGGAATDALLDAGERVRTLVRKEDDRSERLKARGVEVVVGNLSDINDVSAALEGIYSAYFVFPIEAGGVSATAYFAQAASEKGIRAIVNMSQISARREAKSHAARDHWISERIFDWSGTPVTHLRPTFFAQWLTYPGQVASIRKDGVLQLPFGDGRHAPIAAEDQGRVIAAVLRDPVPHSGKVYPLHGPVEMNHYEIASEMSKALGREVTYRPIDLDLFKKRLDSDTKFSDTFAQHLMSVAVDYQDGVFAGTNTVVEDLTGTPPMTDSRGIYSTARHSVCLTHRTGEVKGRSHVRIVTRTAHQSLPARCQQSRIQRTVNACTAIVRNGSGADNRGEGEAGPEPSFVS